jgi:redox-sensing transcriptional repressor
MRLLEQPLEMSHITSAEIESLTGWSSLTIRKDVSYLRNPEGLPLGGSAGYNPQALLTCIRESLGLEKKRRFCIMGLGRLGSAYLNYSYANASGFELAAGFDTNVNRVEILDSPVPLYPAYKAKEVIPRLAIEIALLCVPAKTAQSAAEKLAAAGIRGVVNFAPVILDLPKNIAVRNIHLVDELRELSIKLEE